MKDEIQRLNADVEDRHWWFVGRRRVLGKVVREVLEPGRAVLDVGCGTGANLASLAGEYGTVGFDTSPAAVEHATRRFPGVRFLHGETLADVAGDLPDTDMFLLMDVLEHVPDDRALLEGVVAMAKPGAWIFITVPANPELWSEHDVSHGHYRRYTPETLVALWKGLPVQARLHSGFNSRLYLLALAARTVARIRGRAAGPRGTDLVLPPRPLNALMARVFGGEAGALLSALREGGGGYRHGLSRVVLLQRTAGSVSSDAVEHESSPDRGGAPPEAT